MCDIQVTGANAQVPLLAGGLDGIYRLHTCENGRPAFRRITNPDGGGMRRRAHGRCRCTVCS